MSTKLKSEHPTELCDTGELLSAQSQRRRTHKATQTDEKRLRFRDRVALELELEALKGGVQFRDNRPSAAAEGRRAAELVAVAASRAARPPGSSSMSRPTSSKRTRQRLACGRRRQAYHGLASLVAAGMLEPPEGLRCEPTAREGDAQPLAHAEIVPCRRGGRVRKMEPMLVVSRGTSGVFEMDVPELQLTLRIGVYSSEVRSRKLCIRFSAVDDGEAGAPRVAPACSTPLFVMSRTPNSRNVGVNGKRTREKAAPAPLASAVPMDNLILAEATIVTDPHAARVARDLFGQDDGAL